MKATRRTALAMLGMLPVTVAEAHGVKKRRKPRGRSKKSAGPSKLGILYPFRLSPDMEKSIRNGWKPNTQIAIRDARNGVNREPSSLRRDGVDKLIDADHCTVMIALGGIHVDMAIYTHRSGEIKFYSL